LKRPRRSRPGRRIKAEIRIKIRIWIEGICYAIDA